MPLIPVAQAAVADPGLKAVRFAMKDGSKKVTVLVSNPALESGQLGLASLLDGADSSSQSRLIWGDCLLACQALLAQPYQQKGLLQDAMTAASGRLEQIKSLMNQINGTSDQKAVLEIQARIGAENAMLAHEMSQVQMLTGMADSEERIARARDRERQAEMLNRTGKISDYLH